MILYCYDKSFEGLLTALFDSYVRNSFPEMLIGGGEPEPLFTSEVYHVVSQSDKSERVWRAFEKKVPKEVCNMAMCVWLSELERSDLLLLRYLRKVFDHPKGFHLNFSDPDVLEMRQIAQKVGCEGEYLRQFIRFQKAADGSFFAPVAPLYNALPLALGYLQDRFADQRWLVYDTQRRYGYYYDLQRATEVTIEQDAHLLRGKLSEEMMDSEEELLQKMWRTYHRSLSIKARFNPGLQRQHMPRRFWKYLTELQSK